MARYLYGLDGGSNVTDTFGNKLTRTCTIWGALTGGSQITDLQTPSGTNYSGGVVTQQSNGSIGFLGPDNDRSPKWADFGDGAGRWHIPLVQVADVADAIVVDRSVLKTQRGVAGGVATLDTSGRIPDAQSPASLGSAVTAAQNAAADAAAARAAAEAAEANTQGVTDSAVDAGITRAESQGRLVTAPVPESKLDAVVQQKLNTVGTTTDPGAVRLTGNQEVDGTKAFLKAPVVPINSFSFDRVVGLTTAINSKVAGVGVTELRVLTQAQYDAIVTKSTTTLYWIT